MYRSDRSPVGLYVQNGRELVRANTAAGTGNFYIKPNGIFYVSGESAGILETRRADVAAATVAAQRAFERAPIAPFERAEILRRAAGLFEKNAERLVKSYVAESGFTIADGQTEVARSASVLRISAEEATRIAGEMVPVQGAKGAENKFAYTIRTPIGVVCAITPFNAPISTPIHKIGPAIAAGCPVVFKPALFTPLVGVEICHLFAEAGLPAGWFNLVVGSGSTVGRQLLDDERIAFYHFTGSTAVGRTLRKTIGLRGASLELGSIASTIVFSDADLDVVPNQCAVSAFRKAGQVCTSVQLIYAHSKIADEFAERFARAASALRAGDPAKQSTDIGPLISLAEAERVEAWVIEAKAEGARVLTGGGRNGAVLAPTVVVRPPKQSRLVNHEVFGPVASILPFDTVDEVINWVNSSPYGLATGIFTKDLSVIQRAVRGIRTGMLHVNATSSSRIDMMPFGGVKASGSGKEGPHYAVREMSEERLVVFHDFGI